MCDTGVCVCVCVCVCHECMCVIWVPDLLTRDWTPPKTSMLLAVSPRAAAWPTREYGTEADASSKVHSLGCRLPQGDSSDDAAVGGDVRVCV